MVTVAVPENRRERRPERDHEPRLVVPERHPEERVEQDVEALAEDEARVLEPADRAAVALDEVRVAQADLAIEPPDVLGKVLQVGVDQAHVLAGSGRQPRRPGGGDAPVGRMVHGHHGRMPPGERIHDRAGLVVASVVDEDDLPREPLLLEDAREPLHELRQVPGLVEAGRDDAQLLHPERSRVQAKVRSSPSAREVRGDQPRTCRARSIRATRHVPAVSSAGR